MLLISLALLAATPSTISSVVAGAAGGDTIRLAAGRYPVVTVRARTFVPGLTIDASAASVAGVRVYGSTGLTWDGGEISAPPASAGTGFGVAVSGGHDIAIRNVRLSGFKLGIGFTRVDGGTIAYNAFTTMTSDGIDVALSRHVTVDHNSCTAFTPGPAVHPDCVQLWSRPSTAPTADVVISNTSVIGPIQGIGLFNHVRDGVDDGGFDRITIRNNVVMNTVSAAIAVYDCRSCTVRDNSVDSLPNYVYRAQLYVSGGSVSQCGNSVPQVPRQATPPCPAGTD